MNIFILLPVDLYKNISILSNNKVFIVEDEHYFNRSNIKFNILKPIYHRATMKSYFDYLISKKINCVYINLHKNWVDIIKKNINKNTIVSFYDSVDKNIREKINKNFKNYNIIDTPKFLLSFNELQLYTEQKGVLRQTSFYSWIRKYKKILVKNNSEPEGGKLTFDTENRQKPNDNIINYVSNIKEKNYKDDKYVIEAYSYVKNNFNKNDFYNNDTILKFPIDHKGSINRLKLFIKKFINKFGDYQDIMLNDENNSFIFHSAISPMLNIGLITPNDVIKYVIKYYNKLTIKNKKKMIHNIEGFIRQIIGWREFARYMYEKHSNLYINKNFFNAKKKLDKNWYNGTTNILPIDICIQKAFNYGYLHHIERLMIIANYMTLIGIHPKEMYKWFMAFSIDSYDWVMEYNIYCMASYSDGGQFTSKPYISSSKYILKMSNFTKQDWADKWDKLFWDFLKKHKNKIKKIGRLSMLLKFI